MTYSQPITNERQQNPYTEFTVIIAGNDTARLDFDHKFFRILQVTAGADIKLRFGQTGLVTSFTGAGIGIEHVQAMQNVFLTNNGLTPITVTVAMSMGKITDDRLVISGGVIATTTEAPNTANNSIESVDNTAFVTLSSVSNQKEILIDCTDCTETIGVFYGALAGGETYADCSIKVTAGSKFFTEFSGDINLIGNSANVQSVGVVVLSNV